ncbi:hypothetical protein ES332_D04G184400v1 [Gossypium tomentosum]|uniref:RING-type domain-containing protein n=1 Tax=Gossypium tomentosum TaxID=34277 RepID=A0A5D2LEX2_GOSTO|nr:hypothetical protein ES332_D04G184400v1 [Gossypium tomentosum]
MAAMNPIDISSSDSELETEDVGDRKASSSRILPQWAATNGDAREYKKISNQAQFLNLNSSGVNNHSRTEVLTHDPDDNAKASSQHIALGNGSENFTMNGNIGQPRTVNSRISNGSGTDFEKLTSQQALKRTLPPSLQLSGQSSKSGNLVEIMSNSQIHDAYGNSNHLAGPSSSNSQSYMRDHYNWGNTDGAMYGNISRVLPPSFMQGKSVNFSQFSGPENPVYRAGVSEERAPINDERMVYQAALEGLCFMQDLNQPKIEAELPDGLLSVSLFRHQKIALHWMLQRETRTRLCSGGILADDQGLGKTISMIALIQVQKSLESKSKPEDPKKREFVALNLDDDDDDDDDDNGTGGSDKVSQNKESDDTKSISKVSTSTSAFSRQRLPAGTLVVCPASVLRQWARELDDKVSEKSKLSVLIYHGGSRTKDPSELAKYDVVLTTYSLVTNEVPKQAIVDDDEIDEKFGEKYGLSSDFKRKKTANVGNKGKKGRKGIDGSLVDSSAGALARVHWLRVILDEAQTIKNHRTQVARACCGLRAKRRWCLSGTPIQNAVDDLYSYFRFLRHEPYDVYKSFCYGIKVPIARDYVKGYKKLQAVLKVVMLRRTKATLIDGEPIIKLPPKSIHMSKVEFSSEERAFYNQLEADSRSLFKEYAAAGTLNQNYANILLMLLRLRQACDHPLLVKGFNNDSIRNSDSVENSNPVGQVSVEMAKTLPREFLINLLNSLETSFAICLVCQDTPDEPVVTMCGHVFCYQCVSEHLTGDDNTCPAPECREQLGDDIVFSKATLRGCLAGDLNSSSSHPQFFGKSVILQDDYSSSKIQAVLEILQSKCLLKNSSPESPSSIGSSEAPFSSEQTFKETGHSGGRAVKHTTVYSNLPADGPMKAIIFSQWTGMLNLVEHSLRHHGINYRRLDGTMTLTARDRNVKHFNTDPEVTVMLMSLKAGNLGLNMVAACHVILLDLWWNPTTEDQAIDRAHRIGQTRPVTVTRITIKDTVEDRILSLQDEKRKMVASAFGEDQSGGSATRLTVEDLRYLFMGN